jgi:hypothetical protein
MRLLTDLAHRSFLLAAAGELAGGPATACAAPPPLGRQAAAAYPLAGDHHRQIKSNGPD